MHTYEGETTIFHYNSDFSGDVLIRVGINTKIKVKAKDLLKFIAYCYVASKKRETIENMGYKELLNKENK